MCRRSSSSVTISPSPSRMAERTRSSSAPARPGAGSGSSRCPALIESGPGSPRRAGHENRRTWARTASQGHRMRRHGPGTIGWTSGSVVPLRGGIGPPAGPGGPTAGLSTKRAVGLSAQNTTRRATKRRSAPGFMVPGLGPSMRMLRPGRRRCSPTYRLQLDALDPLCEAAVRQDHPSGDDQQVRLATARQVEDRIEPTPE
jgi:hypothetical protein